MVVAVKYAENQGQRLVPLPIADADGKTWRPRDLLGTAIHDFDGDGPRASGLLLDMRPMSYHAFVLANHL